jgi:hypothetical protein
MASFVFPRRTVLAQLASIPLTASFARTLQAQGAPPQKRLICFMQNNGTKRCNFWPTPGTGPVYPLPAVGPTMPTILNSLFTSDGKATDNGLQAYTTILRGLTASGSDGTNGNQHDIGFAKMFTGAPLVSMAGAPWGGAISLDQIIATSWGVPSLTTAVYASTVESHPKSGFDHRKSFSYSAKGMLNLPMIDPYDAFIKTFPPSLGTSTPTDVAMRKRIALRQSVLDSVAQDVIELQGRLGADDGRKLDGHLTAIRQTEQDLASLLNSKGSCADSPTNPNAPWYAPGLAANPPAFEVTQEQFNDMMIQFMAKLVAAAVKCNVRRVATLQFGYGGGKWAFGWLGPANTLNPAAKPINLNHHDSIAHHDGVDGPTDQPTTDYVTWINQYYAYTIQKVALELLNTPEAGGNMLDHTLIIWANEIGRGDHNMADIPVVLIGLLKNGMSAGNRLIDYSILKNSQQPLNYWGYHALTALGHTTPEQYWPGAGAYSMF